MTIWHMVEWYERQKKVNEKTSVYWKIDWKIPLNLMQFLLNALHRVPYCVNIQITDTFCTTSKMNVYNRSDDKINIQ